MAGTSNAQKTAFARALNQFAEQKVNQKLKQLGKALPCQVVAREGQIVRVSFDINSGFTLPQVTMPIATSLYDWVPLQPGDFGVTQAADTYLGGASGLGGGTADLSLRANLSTLEFVPVSNTAWTVPDTNQRVVQGLTGVLLRDTGAANTFDMTASTTTLNTPGDITITSGATLSASATEITLSAGGHTIVINSTGVIIDGRVFLVHEHSGVSPGGADTGPVV